MASPYISTKDILHYRTLTTLLQHTEAIKGKTKSKRLDLGLTLDVMKHQLLLKEHKGQDRPSSRRNIWKYLTDITEDNLQAEHPDFEVSQAHHLSTKLPTREQSNFLAKQRKAGLLTTDWDESKPFFDKAGLGRLSDFLKSREEAKVASLPDSDPAFKETSSRGKELINEAYRSLNTLSGFLENLGTQAFRTCEWIAEIFELRRTTSDVVPTDKSPSLSQGPTSSSSLYGSSSAGPLSPSPVKEQSPEAEDVEDYDKDIDQDAAMNLDTLTETTQHGWANAAVQWMKDVCTQVVALNSLFILETKTDQNELRLSKYIEKVVLKAIGVMPEARDIRMESYEDVWDNFSHSLRDSETIKDCLLAQETLSEAARRRSRFNGTWHCKIIMMSLHMLSLGSGFETASALGSSAAVSTDIIEMFKHPGSLLMVSKRCCRSCHNLAQFLKRKKFLGQDVPLVFPGSHSGWTSVALPPWLPQEIGKELIEWAEDKLRSQLRKILSESIFRSRNNPRKRPIGAATDVPEEFEERHLERARPTPGDIDEKSKSQERACTMATRWKL
ncbi:MAG: hypothetical protein Q9203_001890 [Teloschistes exilis]